MPKQPTHIGVVREWCQSLGMLSAVNITRDEAELKLAAFVPVLLARFPDEAFTSESLEYCAALAVRGFPTYGELAGWLAAWWRANRPPIVALPPPLPERRPPRTDEELAYVRARVAETIAALHAAPLYGDPKSQSLDDEPGPGVRASYLAPEDLDVINPLPEGRKRV